jgi:reactive intermediate/imine deaminase
MAGKQVVDFGWGFEQGFGYSQAVRVGNLVVLAGQMPVDKDLNVIGEGDIRSQTRRVFENMKAVLAAAGLGLEDVVELMSFHTNMADLEAVAEVKAEYIPRDFPTWTAVGVTALAIPGQMIEIKATAAAA